MGGNKKKSYPERIYRILPNLVHVQSVFGRNRLKFIQIKQSNPLSTENDNEKVKISGRPPPLKKIMVFFSLLNYDTI